MSEPFIAEIRMVGFNFAPRGWAFCNGQLLPISQNTALFSLIGTTYGGDGRTTTALPNLQGRMPMHPGRGPGLTDRRLGESGGTEAVTLSESQIPAHTHGWNAVSAVGDQTSPASNAFASSRTGRGGFLLYDNADNQTPMAAQTVENTGGGQAHNNLQPVLAVNFVIALQGLFPSRN